MTDPCVRRAWLVLGGLSVDLENSAAGYFCSSLDLGYPEVREVTANRPDQDGIDDRTRYVGGRVVTAAITAIAGAGASIDGAASSFAPFMDPSTRPELHYVLDRPGSPERVLSGLRAAAFAWPIVGPYERDIQLQWLASDPFAHDPSQQTATAWSGSATAPGRVYNLTFNRTYPPGGTSPNTAIVTNGGDVGLSPLLRFYGPISGGYVLFAWPGGSGRVGFVSSFVINAGSYVDVDTRRHTARLNGIADPAYSVLVSLDWSTLSWPVVPPGVAATMNLYGTNTSGVTQCQAIWQNGYLS